MDALLVAKNKPTRGQPAPEPKPLDLSELPGLPPEPAAGATTTWKCYAKTAKTLRLIGAHLNVKQEEVLALFGRYFEDYLLTLQTRDVAQRTRRPAED